MRLFDCDDRVSVFIESTGKASMVQSLFHSVGFYNVHIEVTKGRILDLPRRELGVNLDNLSDIKRIAVNPDKLKYIAQFASSDKADLVFLLTDDDIEGEVIASDIQALSDIEPIFRLRLNSLTKKALEDALENVDVVNNDIVKAGIARRTLDRIIGYCQSSFDRKESTFGSVGRILTPTLLLLRDHPQKIIATINRKYIGPDGRYWDLAVPIPAGKSAKSHFDAISTFRDPVVTVSKKDIVNDNTEPLSGPEVLLMMSKALQEPVSKVASSMQSLYEKGRISYPRSDSARLGVDRIKTLNQMANYFGINDFSAQCLIEKAGLSSTRYLIQDAHEAVIPLTDGFDIYSELKFSNLEEKIEVLLARHLIRAGQPSRILESCSGNLVNIPLNREWIEYFDEEDLSPIIKSEYSLRNKYAPQYINDVFSPTGFSSFHESKGQTAIKYVAKDSFVLQLMIENGIGRPSTLAMHSTKISRKYLSDNFDLNYAGESSLFHASRVAKGLLDVESYFSIENVLLSKSLNVPDKIKNSLAIAQIDLSALISSDGVENAHYDEDFTMT